MLVIGHRGASHDHPENTLEAFEGAAAQGADWVELDVRRTADGVLVVHHDPHLPDGRTICELAAGDLPAHVPTLGLALDACHPMGVNVEIKNSPGEPGHDPEGLIAVETVRAIGEHGHHIDILISSFDLPTLTAVRDENPLLATGYLVLSSEEPADAVALAIDAGHRAINPWDPCVTRESVDRCHEAGLEVNVWTVDDPDRIVELASWGVDSVITNRPAVALRALGRPAADPSAG